MDISYLLNPVFGAQKSIFLMKKMLLPSGHKVAIKIEQQHARFSKKNV